MTTKTEQRIPTAADLANLADSIAAKVKPGNAPQFAARHFGRAGTSR